MSLRVEPHALRTYAGQLIEARHVAETARNYVNRWGTFSPHQKGLLGMLLRDHDKYLSQLDTMLTHLAELLETSGVALSKTADEYEHIDLASAAKIDASYPATPRPPVKPD